MAPVFLTAVFVILVSKVMTVAALVVTMAAGIMDDAKPMVHVSALNISIRLWLVLWVNVKAKIGSMRVNVETIRLAMTHQQTVTSCNVRMTARDMGSAVFPAALAT
jgi:hypothetical protein